MQVTRGYSSILFKTDKTSPGVLHTVLGITLEEIQEHIKKRANKYWQSEKHGIRNV